MPKPQSTILPGTLCDLHDSHRCSRAGHMNSPGSRTPSGECTAITNRSFGEGSLTSPVKHLLIDREPASNMWAVEVAGIIPLMRTGGQDQSRAEGIIILIMSLLSVRDFLRRMEMFKIIGAMAEFERALIQERGRDGLRNARAKGRRLGRPRVVVDASRVASFRAKGLRGRRSRRNSG
jgi:Resolvase, N terminal domain